MQSVQAVPRLEQNESAILWRLCHDKHPNKVITVTGDDQPTIFTVSHSPSATYTPPPHRLTFLFRLVDLSLHTTLAGNPAGESVISLETGCPEP